MSEAGPPTVEVVRARLAEVRDRMAAAGGDPDRIEVVAVTKGHGAEVARVAADAGLADLGENYAQELVAKREVLGADAPVRWHVIGRLQTNKVRSLAGIVSLWQSVDRGRLGAEIARRDPGASVLVQLNVSGEDQKGGCPPDEVDRLVDELRDLDLDVRGLMAVAAFGDRDRTRREFALLRTAADRLELPVRSMGMSGDFEAAVSEGATMVRLGSVLFGPRPARRQVGDPSAR